MRITEPYTIFARRLKSGRKVYYYQFRDESGIRSAARSTGCDTMAKARRFCQRMYNEGAFGQDSSRLFGTFARDFFDKEKEFYRWKLANLQRISDSTLQSYARLLNCQVLPFFEKVPLTRINTALVKDWIIWCTDKWSAKTTNNAQSVLNIILKSAREKGLIRSLPTQNLSFRKVSKKKRDLLTVDEIRDIYNSTRWFDPADRKAFLLTAITGMRIGEVIALTPESVKTGYVDVRHSWHQKFGLGDTKTRMCRYVPTPEGLDLMDGSGKTWIFERSGKPVPAHTIYMTFRDICGDLGIDCRERGLTIHSLRNFFISYMQSKNIPEPKIRAVVGHADETMTDLYTYWRPDMFPEVYEIQAELYRRITR